MRLVFFLHDKCNLHHDFLESFPVGLVGECVKALEGEPVARWHRALQRKLAVCVNVLVFVVVGYRVQHVRVFGCGERVEHMPAVAEEALRGENEVGFGVARGGVRVEVLDVVAAVAHELTGPWACVEHGDSEGGLFGLRVRALVVRVASPDVVRLVEQFEQQQRLEADDRHESKRYRVRFGLCLAFDEHIRGPEFCDAVADDQPRRHGVGQEVGREGQLYLVL